MVRGNQHKTLLAAASGWTKCRHAIDGDCSMRSQKGSNRNLPAAGVSYRQVGASVQHAGATACQQQAAGRWPSQQCSIQGLRGVNGSLVEATAALRATSQQQHCGVLSLSWLCPCLQLPVAGRNAGVQLKAFTGIAACSSNRVQTGTCRQLKLAIGM
jgi:hypothetical protein